VQGSGCVHTFSVVSPPVIEQPLDSISRRRRKKSSLVVNVCVVMNGGDATAKPPAAVWPACSSIVSSSNAYCSSLSCVLACAISSAVKHGARKSSCVHVAPIVSALRDAFVMPEPIM